MPATKSATKASAKKAAEKRPGLYANIKAKQERIARGSGERMRKPGDKGAPSSEAFEQSEANSMPPGKSSPSASTKAARRSAAKNASAKTGRAKRTAD